MKPETKRHERKLKTYVIDMSLNVRAESAGRAIEIVRERIRKVRGIRITNVGNWN